MSKRKYSFNNHYFNKIDNQDKAYWFGFLMADGYNYCKKGVVKFFLQEKDKYLIEKFKESIESDHNIIFIDYKNKKGKEHWSNQYGICICSRYLSNVLKEHGITQNKSINAKLNIKIKNDLIRHFIRRIL